MLQIFNFTAPNLMIFYPSRASMKPLIVKLQMVGKEGVTKRIDVFATALTVKMTAHEMRDLDLGYAPPFSPPYDPILIAADELQKKLPGKR